MRITSLFSILLAGGALVSAFPTAANIANLARAGGLDIPDDLEYEEIVRQLKHQQEKRLLINPLDTPIEGLCRASCDDCR